MGNKQILTAVALLSAVNTAGFAQCISGNCRDGYGTYQDAKQRYTGFFNNMMPEGYGVKNFVSGSSYIGQFHEGKYDKTGTFYWNDGTRYIGNWVNGKREGIGTEISLRRVSGDYSAL